MEPASDVDSLRDQAILSSLAGFPFLIVFAAAWTIGGVLSYVVSRELAPWIYVLPSSRPRSEECSSALRRRWSTEGRTGKMLDQLLPQWAASSVG
jgi:hypothetical protein